MNFFIFLVIQFVLILTFISIIISSLSWYILQNKSNQQSKDIDFLLNDIDQINTFESTSAEPNNFQIQTGQSKCNGLNPNQHGNQFLVTKSTDQQFECSGGEGGQCYWVDIYSHSDNIYTCINASINNVIFLNWDQFLNDCMGMFMNSYDISYVQDDNSKSSTDIDVNSQNHRIQLLNGGQIGEYFTLVGKFKETRINDGNNYYVFDIADNNIKSQYTLKGRQDIQEFKNVYLKFQQETLELSTICSITFFISNIIFIIIMIFLTYKYDLRENNQQSIQEEINETSDQ